MRISTYKTVVMFDKSCALTSPVTPYHAIIVYYETLRDRPITHSYRVSESSAKRLLSHVLLSPEHWDVDLRNLAYGHVYAVRYERIE